MGRSMTSLMRSSFEGSSGERKPRKGFKRIIGTHARDDVFRQMRRGGVISVELPIPIIRREQEHLVAIDHVDDIGHAFCVPRAGEGLRGPGDGGARYGSPAPLQPR